MRAGEGIVGQKHDAAMVHRQQAILHGGENGGEACLLPGGGRELLLDPEGGLVQHPGETPEFIVAILADPFAEVAAGQGLSPFQDPGHGLGQRARQGPGQTAGQDQDAQQGEAKGDLELRDPHLDAGK